MRYSIESLQRMSPQQRLAFYKNVQRLRDKGAQEVIDLIDASGLPLSMAGLDEMVLPARARCACQAAWSLTSRAKAWKIRRLTA